MLAEPRPEGAVVHDSIFDKTKRLEDSHWISLFCDYIPNRRRHTLTLPQPPRAPMPSPPLASGLIQPGSVQAAARIGLEVVHGSLGTSLRCHYKVNVISAYVGGYQAPVTLGAPL
jgi:hypothetical protein